MKVHGLLLDRAAPSGAMTDASPSMSATAVGACSDGFEIGCDNGERVRAQLAFIG